MDLDKLQNAWKSQNTGDVGKDFDATLKAVTAKRGKFERAIFWRDVREVGVALIMVPFFVVGAHKVGHVLWPWYAGAACIAWVAAYIFIDRRIWREPGPGASVRAALERALRGVDHQIHLLRNVISWYLLPCLAATLLPAGEMASRVPREMWGQCYPPFAVLFGLVVFLYPGIYWLNQHAVRTYLLPLRRELEETINSLDAQDEEHCDDNTQDVDRFRHGWGNIMSGKWQFILNILFIGVIAYLVIEASLAAPSMRKEKLAISWPGPEAARQALGRAIAPKPKELAITRARYGAGDSWVDVTTQIRNQIKDNALLVQVGNSLAGDPAYLKSKRFEMEYVLDGRKESLTLPEGAFLEIPGPGPIDTAKDLLAFVQQCPAEVGYFGINLDTGQTVEYRPDQPACMASIVKLFTLLEVMTQARAGQLSLTDQIQIEGKATTINDALDLMIGRSDNAATGALTARVGYDRVNALPAELGMTGVSAEILPKPGILEGVLDKRVRGLRVVPPDTLLPQHATAKGMTRFFELMHRGELKSPELSADVRAVLDRHPRTFVPHAPEGSSVVGKGGSLSWKRPPTPAYNMIGWNLYVTDGRQSIAFCMWCEWFPEQMPQDQMDKWCFEISDGIAGVLLKAGGAS